MPPLDFTDTKIAFAPRSSLELYRAQLLFRSFNYLWLIHSGSRLLNTALSLKLPITPLVRLSFFDHFCGGVTNADCAQTVTTLGKYQVHSVLDYSVEGLGDEAAFAATTAETLRTLEQAGASELMPYCVFKMTGIGRTELLAKASSAPDSLTKPEQEELSRIEQRLHTLCAATAKVQRRLLIDAEESWIQPVIDAMALRMMREFNKSYAVVYNTVQMYRVGRLDYIKELHAQAQRDKFIPGFKLVRGAYMEKERARAAKLGQPSPIQPTKAASDQAFDDGVAYCLSHIDEVELFAGTHNETSVRRLVKGMADRSLAPDDKRIEVSQLLGMSDNLSFNLANAGFRVAKYVPYGPVAAVLPYLVRRAEENSSIAGQAGRELQMIEKELRRRRLSS